MVHLPILLTIAVIALNILTSVAAPISDGEPTMYVGIFLKVYLVTGAADKPWRPGRQDASGKLKVLLKVLHGVRHLLRHLLLAVTRRMV